MRCAGKPSLQAFRKALSGHPFLEAAERPRHLGPIDAAASGKILYGTVRKDDTAVLHIERAACAFLPLAELADAAELRAAVRAARGEFPGPVRA